MSRPNGRPAAHRPDAAKDDYVFSIRYLLAGGEQIEHELLRPRDFQRAVFAAHFDGLRRGVFRQYRPRLDAARIEPVFEDCGDPARIRAFVVTVVGEENRAHAVRYDHRYFQSRANRVRAKLLRSERIESDMALHYHVSAYFDDRAGGSASGMPIELGALSTQVPIEVGYRSEYGRCDPWDDPRPGDLPVLIDHAVLEEAVEETRRQADREIGGFLLGHLHRDPEADDLALVVTGLVSSAGTTEASSTSVTFTPDSFAHARCMIRLRGEGELLVGWYHSHPFRFCAECPLDTPPECIEKVLFFSLDDVQLMESTFEHPYLIGLLTAVEPRLEQALGHLPVRLFGYRQGQIVRRGFEVFGLHAERSPGPLRPAAP